jgi:hypothetical protein
MSHNWEEREATEVGNQTNCTMATREYMLSAHKSGFPFGLDRELMRYHNCFSMRLIFGLGGRRGLMALDRASQGGPAPR